MDKTLPRWISGTARRLVPLAFRDRQTLVLLLGSLLLAACGDAGDTQSGEDPDDTPLGQRDAGKRDAKSDDDEDSDEDEVSDEETDVDNEPPPGPMKRDGGTDASRPDARTSVPLIAPDASFTIPGLENIPGLFGDGGLTFPGLGGTTTPVEPLDPSVKAPDESKLPTVNGPCPRFADGATENVAGINVKFWSGPAGRKGPLVFYWHGTGGSSDEAVALFGITTGGLGLGVIDQIKSQGGIVASPDNSTGGGNLVDTLVWATDDFNAADQIVACAIEAGRVDPGRIHALGFSAGGLMAGTMYYLRSNYLASVVTYSGGLSPWPGNNLVQDLSNKVPVMLFHGGTDDWVGLAFQDQSIQLATEAKSRGVFAVMCNHGGGHVIPIEGPDAAWAFFKAHPYNVNPEPWESRLPASMPGYCETF